jgi:hypothetical protein
MIVKSDGQHVPCRCRWNWPVLAKHLPTCNLNTVFVTFIHVFRFWLLITVVMYCVYRQQQTLMITSIGCFPTVSVESKSIVWSMKSPSCCQMKWTLIRSKKRNCALTVMIVIYWRIIYFLYPFNDLYCIKIHLILYFISAR